MVAPVRMDCSRTYPLTVADGYDRVIGLPLEQVFDRRYRLIPPIRAVEGQDGAWGTLGQTRTIRLADGGSMREELVRVDRPSAFGYVLSDVTGPNKPLIARVDGQWSFAPAGTGVRITWTWTVHPTLLGRFAMPVFTRLWHGYAAQALAHLEELLVE